MRPPVVPDTKYVDGGAQTFYRHLILAQDGAFRMPAQLADKASLLDYDHERARGNLSAWRSATISKLGGAQVAPEG